MTETIYEGKILSLTTETHVGADQRSRKFEIVRKRPCVAVVAQVGQQVIMVRQFRPAVGEVVCEIPAGIIDPGESPEQAGKRELQEETGYHGGYWTYLGQMVTSPGFTDEVCHLFHADDLQPGPQRPCDAPLHHVVSWDVAELLGRMAFRGARDPKDQDDRDPITDDAKTEVGLFRAMLHNCFNLDEIREYAGRRAEALDDLGLSE